MEGMPESRAPVHRSGAASDRGRYREAAAPVRAARAPTLLPAPASGDTRSGSRRLSLRASEQPGRLDQQHRGRDQIEDGELDFGKELNSRGAHEAYDQRADERA